MTADIIRECGRVTYRHSKTFYFAARAFPREVRNDVFVLYAFVRTVDDFVDQAPPLRKEFEDWRQRTRSAFSSFSPLPTDPADPVIRAFRDMCLRREIPLSWVEDFFASQELDMDTSSYATFSDLERFIYGVADVIGLMMCRIMGVPDEGLVAGRLLGKSMQLINIFRDIAEDAAIGRVYIPREDLTRFGLSSPIPSTPEERGRFSEMMLFQLARYDAIRAEAERSFPLIPAANRKVIRATDAVYRHLASVFRKDPLIVLERKVKPSRLRILGTVLKHLLVRERS
jgi:phytoene synthase